MTSILDDIIALDPVQAAAEPVNQNQNQNQDVGWAEYAAKFIASTANAVTGDFGDEALSAIGKGRLASRLGVGELASMLKESEQHLKDNGVWGDYTLSKILGSLVPGGAIGKALGIGRGITKAGNTARAVGAGAIEGAIFGAGEAEGAASERVDDALRGAALGAGGTLVLGKVIDGISAATRGGLTLSERIRNVGTPTSQRDKKIFDTAVSEISEESKVPKNVILGGLNSGKSLQNILQENGLTERQSLDLISAPLNRNAEAAFQVGRAARSSLTTERRQLADIAKAGLEPVGESATKQAGKRIEEVYESNILQGADSPDNVISTPFNESLDELVKSHNARLLVPELDKQVKKALRDPKYSDDIADAGYSASETPEFKRFTSKEEAFEKTGSYNLIQLVKKDSSEEFIPIRLDSRILRRVFSEIDDQSGKAFGRGAGDEGQLLAEAQEYLRGLSEDYFARQGLRQANIDYSKIKNANQIMDKTRALVRKSEVTPSDIEDFTNLLNSNKNMNEVDKFDVMQTVIADVASASRKPVEIPLDIKKILREEVSRKGIVNNEVKLENLENLVERLNAKITFGKTKTIPPEVRSFADASRTELAKAAPVATVFGITAGIKIALARLTFQQFRKKFSGDIKYSDPKKVETLFNQLTKLDDTSFYNIVEDSLRSNNNKSLIQNFFDIGEEKFFNARTKSIGTVAGTTEATSSDEVNIDTQPAEGTPVNSNNNNNSVVLKKHLGSLFPLVEGQNNVSVEPQGGSLTNPKTNLESLGNLFPIN